MFTSAQLSPQQCILFRNVLIFDSVGKELCDCHVFLSPAPIGSVNVSISCSSSGAMRASCSSDGDQILYSWTLNGGPWMDGDSSIDLDNVTDGNISCSVENHVSHGQKTISFEPCSGERLIHESSRKLFIKNTATRVMKMSESQNLSRTHPSRISPQNPLMPESNISDVYFDELWWVYLLTLYVFSWILRVFFLNLF